MFKCNFLHFHLCPLIRSPSEPSLLQTKQPQRSQPCLIHNTPAPYLGPAFDSFQYEHSSFTQGVQQRRKHPRYVSSVLSGGKRSPLPLLSVLCLMQLRMPAVIFAMRAHCWLTFNLVSIRTPKGLLCTAAFQLGSSQLVVVPGVVPSQGQDFALPLVELHEGPVGPFLQPVQVPLDISTTLWPISHSSQVCLAWALYMRLQMKVTD